MIDYKILNDSLEYYENLNYNRIEVPWLVTEAVDAITRPNDVEPYHVVNKNKNLIASGEQGFLYLGLKEYLAPGKYVTLTPCFRNDSYDLTHSKNFMKVELIHYQPKHELISVLLENMINDSFNFFSNFIPVENLKCVEMDNGSIDIVAIIDDVEIELGSYGYREFEHMKWIYGTGCAEPRTSRIINKLK